MSGARQWRRRSQAQYGPERGTTYLLHFDQPYQHARHYTGWTTDLPARLDQHRRGEGSVLMKAVRDAGISFTLTRTWPDTTRDREDSLKHQGSARRFCPACGIKPATSRLASDHPAPPSRAAAEQLVPEYDFAGWPELTAGASPGQAIALALHLWRGRFAAFTAAAQAWDTPGYAASFDTACDVTLAWQKAAREIAGLYGREPGEFVREWISRTRLRPAGPERQETMAKDRAAWRDKSQQAEADRLFALADQLADQIERPNYQHQITAERAARIREQIGGDLAADARAQAPEPRLDGAGLDAEIERLAEMYPEPQAPDPQPRAERAAAGQQAQEGAQEMTARGYYLTSADFHDRQAKGERERLARWNERPRRGEFAAEYADYLTSRIAWHERQRDAALAREQHERDLQQQRQARAQEAEESPEPGPSSHILAPGETAAPAPDPTGIPDRHPSPMLAEYGQEMHGGWSAGQPEHQLEAG